MYKGCSVPFCASRGLLRIHEERKEKNNTHTKKRVGSVSRQCNKSIRLHVPPQQSLFKTEESLAVRERERERHTDREPD